MTKNEIWQLLIRKNKALSGDKVSISAEQMHRLVDFVYDTAYAKGKSSGDALFNGLFGGMKR